MNKLSRNNHLILLLLGSLLVAWPTLIWYQARMTDGSDNNWGVFALIVACCISFAKRATQQTLSDSQLNLKIINFLLLGYFVAQLFSFYALVQGVIFALLLASILSQFNNNSKLNFGLVGLMILSLPLFASLDFYFGYPLRYFIGLVSSFLLNLQGLGIRLEGVNLVLADKVILIDGPCSGIKMMWTGSFLVFSFVAYFNLSFTQSVKLSLMAFTAILIANILRINALFYIESGLFESLQWMHEPLGLVCYGFAIISILYFGLRQVRNSNPIKGVS